MNTFADSTIFAPPSETFPCREDVHFVSDGVLFYGESEERSQLPARWISHFTDGRAYRVIEHDTFGLIGVTGTDKSNISLRETAALRDLISSIEFSSVYLDITGLCHHVWMPLLRTIIDLNRTVYCIYTEPSIYTPSANPRPGDFYQLSDKIRGFVPIPTFARLPSRTQRGSLLVPLLGFEGVRFKYLVECFQPDEHSIYPIVGIPGFEIDYPFHTFEGNADILKSTKSYQRLDYVDASCPFALFHHLEALRSEWPERLIQLAVIGTKPHALGAMLYALHDSSVELLHDHPIRKKGRTQGSGRCHLYNVTAFLSQGS